MLVRELRQTLAIGKLAFPRIVGANSRPVYWFTRNNLLTGSSWLKICARCALDIDCGVPDTLHTLLLTCDDEATIEVTKNGNELSFVAGSARFKLPMRPLKENEALLDNLPKLPKAHASLNAADFYRKLKSVYDVIKSDPSRAEFRGVTAIAAGNNALDLFSRTRNELGINKIVYDGELAVPMLPSTKDRRVILPTEWLKPVLEQMSLETDKNAKVQLYLSGEKMVLQCGGVIIAGGTLLEEVPKPFPFLKFQKRAVQTDEWYRIREHVRSGDDVEVKDHFGPILDRAHIIANGALEQTETNFRIEGDVATLASKSVLGEIVDTMKLQRKHRPCAGRFNPAWLRDHYQRFTHFTWADDVVVFADIDRMSGKLTGAFYICTAE